MRYVGSSPEFPPSLLQPFQVLHPTLLSLPETAEKLLGPAPLPPISAQVWPCWSVGLWVINTSWRVERPAIVQIRGRMPDAPQRRRIKPRPQEFPRPMACPNIMHQQIGKKRRYMAVRTAHIRPMKDRPPALCLRSERPVCPSETDWA